MNNKFSLKLIKLLLVFLIVSCSSVSEVNNDTQGSDNDVTKNITIFFVNDQHAQLDNFAKVKHVIDQEKINNNVIVACSGDMFSGSPVVDNYKDDQGFPMIDVMNKVGFDISVLGNHEFDYGEETLKKRIEQANFEWVCANVDMLETDVPQPKPYHTITKGDTKVTFLGLVETNGKDNGTIPSTHPWKVQNLSFERPETVVANYKDVKESEESDIYIALTHLGHNSSNLGDVQLAQQFPYFDLIIGGHSHQEINTVINGVPIFQAGSYLKNLGKIEISVKNKTVTNIEYSLINLDAISDFDEPLKTEIDEYNNLPDLDEVFGNSLIYHERYKVGCFYADALKNAMNVDVAFQNSGGVRSDLEQGDITKKDIFKIEPFNNGTVKYQMSVQQIKNFLVGTASGFYFSGIQITQVGQSVEIKNESGDVLSNDTFLSVGLNDYIPAVHDNYFPLASDVQPLSAAESIMYYLQNITSQVNYPDCANYFRYSN